MKNSAYRGLQVIRLLSALSSVCIVVSIWIQPSLPTPWGMARFWGFFVLALPGVVAALMLKGVNREELING